ncbi:MAG: hypothetical protein HY902_03540 [Deltaproteobacteria bacterium]|nr:hypothetical protein [Deltaproteobacteria bacterium]
MSPRTLAVLPLALLALTACQSTPEQTCLALDQALHRRDLEAVHRLVTRASVPAVDVLWRAGDAQSSPLRLPAQAPNVTVKAVRSQGVRQIATVARGSVEREWVLLEEDGRWRLDLFETALRRPWSSSARDD